ncbi:unnamed protein product [Bemisia tabaci]|uniref:Uncharacterized protein n=1 Tax=Bemisia tabaci TaxID=7038 RepID=A0A9P0AC72_BEMTA|nr:unnamed protein product [Bemisia tabaci]
MIKLSRVFQSVDGLKQFQKGENAYESQHVSSLSSDSEILMIKGSVLASQRGRLYDVQAWEDDITWLPFSYMATTTSPERTNLAGGKDRRELQTTLVFQLTNSLPILNNRSTEPLTLLGSYELDAVLANQWGKNHEEVKKLFEQCFKIKVKPCGLFLHERGLPDPVRFCVGSTPGIVRTLRPKAASFLNQRRTVFASIFGLSHHHPTARHHACSAVGITFAPRFP